MNNNNNNNIFFYCAAEYQSRSILLRQLLNRQSGVLYFIKDIKKKHKYIFTQINRYFVDGKNESNGLKLKIVLICNCTIVSVFFRFVCIQWKIT